MVYAGLYPMDNSEYDRLRDALDKILLTDTSIRMQKESSLALGLGFRCGFLGMLHMDVFLQRLDQEYGAEVLATAPSVPYKVTTRDGKSAFISNPGEFPDDGDITQIEEPMVQAAIVTPREYLNAIIALCRDKRGIHDDTSHLGERCRMSFKLPLSEVITDFFGKLKELTSGYASFEYEEIGYEAANLVKVNIMINGSSVDALSLVVHQESAHNAGKVILGKLKDIVPKQLFQVALQASIGSKVIARESIAASRKDVLAKCYGGDMTRKRKLLDKQKEGKRKLKMIGNVELPPEAFFEILRRN